ncbi:MAG: hypothetical protein ACRD4Q_15670 [Candidatus Acidiferrales bacterium]
MHLFLNLGKRSPVQRVRPWRGCHSFARPDKRLGVAIVLVDVSLDSGNQLAHARQAVVPNAVLGDAAEETFDHLQPSGTGAREVHI